MGLGVIRVGADPVANLDAMVGMARQAARGGAELVLFPEAVLTGLINDDDPVHDLPLGQSIPGPATETLGGASVISHDGTVIARKPLGAEGLLRVNLL